MIEIQFYHGLKPVTKTSFAATRYDRGIVGRSAKMPVGISPPQFLTLAETHARHGSWPRSDIGVSVVTAPARSAGARSAGDGA
jgi:hypothetical protein